MHAKTDSEVTSIAPSSPARSPTRAPAYYVQSPSRDSHDGGDKTATTASFHSTPALLSPSHSHSSVGRHSRGSSTSRFSGSLKPPTARKVSPNDPDPKAWKKKDFGAIEEEGLLDDDPDYGKRLIPRRCYFPLFVLAFFALFSFFSLILWGASRSQKPHIVMKSVQFNHFNIQAGTDASGVPTDMATLNATVKMTYRNTGSFFGVHVGSSTIDLFYSQLKLGSGDINEFYQGRKSQRSVTVVVMGNKVPLYGIGAGLTTTTTTTTVTEATKGKKTRTITVTNPPPPVNVTVSFTVRSRAYVLGKVVKPKFYNDIKCLVVMDQTKLGKPVALGKSCEYN